MRDRGRREDQDSEVTLSPASLLGIFLGLVLVCGVFFGFGYSIGRRATGGESVFASADNEAEGTDALTPSVAKPSPARASDSDGATRTEGSASSGKSATILETTGPAPVTVPVSDTPSTAATPMTANAADGAIARGISNNLGGAKSDPSRAPAGAAQKASEDRPETGQTVVQVAAVTRREDADVLVSALRQRGYRAMERNEPQDKLVHVQVGPFSSREDANTMKQKLLADGYNAIIKP
jgi:DedD protein